MVGSRGILLAVCFRPRNGGRAGVPPQPRTRGCQEEISRANGCAVVVCIKDPFFRVMDFARVVAVFVCFLSCVCLRIELNCCVAWS